VRIERSVMDATSIGDRSQPSSSFGPTLVPVVVSVLLLFVALSVNGAFAVRHWAPICLFVLVILASARRRSLGAAPLVAVLGLFGLAAWALASTLWAAAPGSALEGGARVLLYAGLFALPVVTLHERRSAQIMAVAALFGLALVVVGTWVHMLVDGESACMAG